nr:MAG TPA: hypothetical protein [Ackermannviridae sp.]
MEKRGRKPSAKRKGYFYEKQEEAVVRYINTEDVNEKCEIFNEILLPAFTKLIESIIRRYKLQPGDEGFDETFNDTMSFLMTKIDKFKPEQNKKAYSYYGTICKNYLMGRINQNVKNLKRTERYDLIQTDFVNNLKYSYQDNISDTTFLTELMGDTVKNIESIINNKEKLRLNENETKVGLALINLMGNWEDLFAQMGSDKFNKSSILLFLRETTNLNTKEIRDGMKRYKSIYYNIKKKMIETIY